MSLFVANIILLLSVENVKQEKSNTISTICTLPKTSARIKNCEGRTQHLLLIFFLALSSYHLLQSREGNKDTKEENERLLKPEPYWPTFSLALSTFPTFLRLPKLS